jgi:hypothetical protein
MQIGPGEQMYSLTDVAPGSEGAGVFVLFSATKQVVFIRSSSRMRDEIDRLVGMHTCVMKHLPVTFQFQVYIPSALVEREQYWKTRYNPLCP